MHSIMLCIVLLCHVETYDIFMEFLFCFDAMVISHNFYSVLHHVKYKLYYLMQSGFYILILKKLNTHHTLAMTYKETDKRKKGHSEAWVHPNFIWWNIYKQCWIRVMATLRGGCRCDQFPGKLWGGWVISDGLLWEVNTFYPSSFLSLSGLFFSISHSEILQIYS